MIDNLGIIAAIIFLLWFGSLGLYLYASRQHSGLQKDIEKLQRALGEESAGEYE